MISLNSIHLERFRTFAEKTCLSFPPTGLIQIKGMSGVGKSNIFESIAYVLGYSSLSVAQVKSWGQEKDASVKLFFSVNGTSIDVARDPKQRLTQNGIEFKGGAKDLIVQMETMFGIPLHLFGLLTYRPQQGLGSFIRKTDVEKKDFLTELLSELQKYEQQIQVSQDSLKQLQLDFNVYKATVDVAQRQYDEATKAVIDSKPERHLPFLEAEWQPAKDALEAGQAKLKKWQENLSVKSAELKVVYSPGVDTSLINLEIKKFKQEDEVRRSGIENERLGLNKQIIEYETLIKTKADIIDKIDKLEVEIDAAERDICFACKQPWIQADGQTKIDVKRNKIREFNKVLVRIESAKERLPQIKQSLANLVFLPNPKIQELELEWSKITKSNSANQQQNIQQVEDQRKLLNEKFQHAVKLLDLDSLVRTERELAQKYQDAKSQEVIWQNNLKLMEKRLTELKKSQEVLERTTTKIQLEQDFIKLVGREGFLGLIFDEILADITNEANQILAQVPNTTNITVKFLTEGQTLKGIIKRSIVLEVTINGNKTAWNVGCSGGQQTVVALAIDLALGRVIARRSNVNPGFLILDEPFDGCDVPSKMACLEMLKKYSEDKLIMVVDHSLDVDLYDQRLTVVNENGCSTVTVQI
jgi:DNA repair exonuclease SbcCD ATPase subunit